METALATREEVPENLVWQAPCVPEQPTGKHLPINPPQRSVLEPPATEALRIPHPWPRRSSPKLVDVSPLTLFLGGFLLLCKFLVFGAARERRGS
jgi:hypothetical protein